MNPACELCGGACCKSITLSFPVIDPGVSEWLGLHGEKAERGTRFLCQCRMLKEGKCSIYPDRPSVCREYSVGSPSCFDAVHRFNPDKEQQIRRLILRHGEEQTG